MIFTEVDAIELIKRDYEAARTNHNSISRTQKDKAWEKGRMNMAATAVGYLVMQEVCKTSGSSPVLDFQTIGSTILSGSKTFQATVEELTR